MYIINVMTSANIQKLVDNFIIGIILPCLQIMTSRCVSHLIVCGYSTKDGFFFHLVNEVKLT